MTDTIHRTRRKLSIINPIDRDVTIVLFIQYDWEEDIHGIPIDGTGKSRVLTLDGWHEYEGYQTFRHLNMPEIDGIDMAMNTDKLKEFEETMRRLLFREPVNDKPYMGCPHYYDCVDNTPGTSQGPYFGPCVSPVSCAQQGGSVGGVYLGQHHLQLRKQETSEG